MITPPLPHTKRDETTTTTPLSGGRGLIDRVSTRMEGRVLEAGKDRFGAVVLNDGREVPILEEDVKPSHRAVAVSFARSLAAMRSGGRGGSSITEALSLVTGLVGKAKRGANMGNAVNHTAEGVGRELATILAVPSMKGAIDNTGASALIQDLHAIISPCLEVLEVVKDGKVSVLELPSLVMAAWSLYLAVSAFALHGLSLSGLTPLDFVAIYEAMEPIVSAVLDLI